MDHLQDPRRFGAGTSPLLGTVTAVVAGGDVERGTQRRALRAELQTLLLDGDDEGIRRALAAMPDALHFRTLFEELMQVVESPQIDRQAVRLRLFAFPLVLVAAAREPVRLAGSLSAVDAVQRIFERSGALGPMRNFGLSAALCSPEGIESLSPVMLNRAARMVDANAVGEHLRPAEVEVPAGREQAHLRFLVGAGISSADAPGFSETAANIAAWGTEMSKLLRAELALADTQLLVLPRPPTGLMRAPHAGRSAQLDVALHLFVSNTVRRIRMTAGEPVAILSTHDDDDLRLTLSSVFAEDLVEGFRWPLAQLDHLEAIQSAVAQLLRDVRIEDVRVLPAVMPAARVSGGAWYPRAAEWNALRGRAARH